VRELTRGGWWWFSEVASVFCVANDEFDALEKSWNKLTEMSWNKLDFLKMID
jgi:hypothetical protein